MQEKKQKGKEKTGMKYAKRRVLCIVLSLVVAITMAPYIGFADGEDVDWEIYAYDDQFSFTYDDIEEGKEFNLKPEIKSDGDVDELGLTYQWYVSSGYDEETGEYIWNDIAGATGASYIAVMTDTKDAAYRCVATDKYGKSKKCTYRFEYEHTFVDWGLYCVSNDEISFSGADIKRKKTFNLRTGIDYDGDIVDLGITYQWSVSDDYYDERTWNDIAGATGSRYTISMTNKKELVYKCTATDKYGNSNDRTFWTEYDPSGGDPFWKLKKPSTTQRLSKKHIKIYIQNGIKADKPFRATSSNSKVATAKIVNNSYVYVKFIKPGIATIKVTDVNGNSATCTVKVYKDNINKTTFPDSIFRAYVRKNFDKNKDWNLSKAELRKVKIIYIKNEDLKNLKGIGMFYNLRKLTIKRGLNKVNLSKNKKLRRLVFDCANVKYLDLSNNKKLEYVKCDSNGSLRTLKLPKTKTLKKLICPCSDRLKTLDIRNCKGLTYLDAKWGGIKEIKIGTHKKLEKIDLNGNKIKKINLAKCPKLEKLDVGSNRLGTLNLKKNKKLKKLDCYDNKITKLYFGKNKKLESINGETNKLTKVSLKYCSSLKYANFQMNKLKKLDVRKCKKLKSVWIDSKTRFIKSGSWKKNQSTRYNRDGTITTLPYVHWYR